MKKRYLVVLDADSAAARMLISAKQSDYDIKAGDTLQPALLCTHVETGNPGGIWATRDPAMTEGQTQSVFFPTGTVVGILEYDADQPAPMGFVPRES